LKKFVGTAHTNIYKAIGVLQNEDLIAPIKYQNVLQKLDDILKY
jgi:hypothetical protein